MERLYKKSSQAIVPYAASLNTNGGDINMAFLPLTNLAQSSKRPPCKNEPRARNLRGGEPANPLFTCSTCTPYRMWIPMLMISVLCTEANEAFDDYLSLEFEDLASLLLGTPSQPFQVFFSLAGADDRWSSLLYPLPSCRKPLINVVPHLNLPHLYTAFLCLFDCTVDLSEH